MTVLDTAFVIDVLRGDPAAQKILGRLVSTAQQVFVPATVVQELYMGAELSSEPAKERARVEEILAGIAVLAFDKPAARATGILEGKRRQSGRRLGRLDAQIATTALAHGMSLVTRDRGIDIEGLDVITYESEPGQA